MQTWNYKYPDISGSRVRDNSKAFTGTGNYKTSLTDSLVKDEQVEFISPVYKDKETGNLIFVTNELNVAFKEGVDKQTIEKFNLENGLNIVKQDEFSPRQYVLKVNDANNSDISMEVYQKLSNESEIIEFVDPISCTGV